MRTDIESLIADLVAYYGDWFADPQVLESGQMTAALYPYTRLFSPLQINRMKLKNRLVMGPMGNISMADAHGRPSAKMIAYFVERARGGVGLITSGLVPVCYGVDPTVSEPGGLSYFPRIDGSRAVWAGWRDLAEGVHAYGARFFIQLTSGLGRVGSPECVTQKYQLPVSASWNPNFYMPQIPCRPLTDGECGRIIRATGQAAADARACLIDGVYLHGHEGYLLEQLTNPAFNRRKLGRYADWEAFGLALVREIRERCGPEYPIMYRIDLSLALRATYGERLSQVKALRNFADERSVAMTLDYMEHLVGAGVDCFDVDLGCYDNWWLPHPPAPMPPGCYLPLSRLVKEYFTAREVRSNAGLAIPIVGVGKLGYPDLAERALREEACDLVMLARPLLADPEWPHKAFAGRVAEIRPCIGDHEACINEFIRGGHPQCAVNPRAGFEELLPATLPPASQARRVAVVGAGPAGIVCACAAAERGHAVTLFDRRARVGGMLLPGAVPKAKFDVANYLAYLDDLAQRHVRAHGLTLALNTEVTPALLAEGGFDVVVTCTGTRPLPLSIPGIDRSQVVSAIDLLQDPSRAADAARVVVIGGGEVGCEVAHFLACELHKQVLVIERLPYLMKEACSANRNYLLYYLHKQGVALWNCAQVTQVTETGVTVSRNVSPTVPDPTVAWGVVLPENIKNPLARPLKEAYETVDVQADLVVVAVGLAPADALYEACVREQVAPEVYNVGDSFAPGRVFEAVKAGYAVGCSL